MLNKKGTGQKISHPGLFKVVIWVCAAAIETLS